MPKSWATPSRTVAIMRQARCNSDRFVTLELTLHQNYQYFSPSYDWPKPFVVVARTRLVSPSQDCINHLGGGFR